MKPKLALPLDWESFEYWNHTLCRMLVSSGVFEVELKTFPLIRLPGTRNGNFHQMAVNGKVVGVDTWDTRDPLHAYVRQGFFTSAGPCHHLDMVVKIQSAHPDSFWDDVSAAIQIPVRPWTIFPSSFFPLGFFQWKNKSFKYTSSLTGKNNRFGRQVWVDWCKQTTDFYVKEDYTGKDELEDFKIILQNCKWGTSLSGRRGAFKNRRECEFTSCGMPLAMNYVPSYAFDFIPDRHFVHLQKPEDLAKLRDIDPEPFADASKQLYREHFSPEGMANDLVTMVKNL